MSQVEAVYRHGVFEPLGPVNLPEHQRVRLSIEPAGARDGRSWLKEVQELQSGVVQRQDILPDSICGIAADRRGSHAMNDSVVDLAWRRH